MLCRTLSPGTGPTRSVCIWSGFFASVNLVPRDLLFVRNWFGFWLVFGLQCFPLVFDSDDVITACSLVSVRRLRKCRHEVIA